MRDYQLGSIIRVRRLRGTGAISDPASVMGSVLPPLLGGGVAILTTVGIRHLMEPTSETQVQIARFAPYIGAASGVVTALALAWTTGQPAAASAAATVAVVTLGFALSEWAARRKLKDLASGETLDAVRRYGLARVGRTGAIVPEYGGTRGVGAIVMEPQASRGYGAGPLGRTRRMGTGAYGDVVTLGNINAAAFGSPGFQVAGQRRAR